MIYRFQLTELPKLVPVWDVLLTIRYMKMKF